MKTRLKRALPILVAFIVCIIGLSVIGCGGDKKPAAKPPATEVYYGEISGVEYELDISGNAFTLNGGSDSRKGVISIKGNAITLKFSDGATETGEKSGTVITVSYNGASVKFYENINYTVSFDTDGGSAVASQTVRNGKKAIKPNDPTRADYAFIGWYTDNTYKTAYDFGSQIVTGDVTVYAYWVHLNGEIEYTVDFDLNYDGAPKLDGKQTVGGMVINAPVPTRTGYEFKGWWVSMTMTKADGKPVLSYVLKPNTVLEENTTLYALWLSTAAGDKLPAPVVDVTETGISWQAVGMTANGYAVTVTGPNDYSLDKTELTTSTSIDFSALPAGDYTITVIARSSAGTEKYSDPTVRVYRNKALARVSKFEVKGDVLLVYNGVKNATDYKIYVECDVEGHKHAPLDNGSATNYNFASCGMRESGINFYVQAEADGYVTSKSAVFNYDRRLGAIDRSALLYAQGTETVSWPSVEKATGYKVQIGDGASVIVSDTSIDIREQNDGQIKIAVTPIAVGYNSPKAAEITVDKSTLATPANVRIEGSSVKWNAVTSASKYVVTIDGKTYDCTTAELDLSDKDIAWTTGKKYTVTVKSVNSSKQSLESYAVEAEYNAMSGGVTYGNNTVKWQYVLGATAYDVCVNDGEVTRVTGANTAEITLTKAGANTVKVRWYLADDEIPSAWVSTTVNAYALNYDLNGGSGTLDAQYYAVGDEITLYSADSITGNKTGHRFIGWYTSEGDNAPRFELGKFTAASDVTVFAGWKANTYTVTLNYNILGAGKVTTVDVVYGEEFKISPPTEVKDGMYGFVGWYRGTHSSSIKYTDENGVGLGVWNEDSDLVVYAQYRSVLAFEKQRDGTYWVKAGEVKRSINSVAIPAEYQGEDDDKPYPVTTLGSTAFNSCADLKTIRIPASIKAIDRKAFNNCVSLTDIEVYDVAGVGEPIYWAEGGVLFYENVSTGVTDLWYYPLGKTDETYTVPAGVESIPNQAFIDCKFKEVIIPATVNYIGVSAFYNTVNLTTVTFLADETYIKPEGSVYDTPQPLYIAGGAFKDSSGIEKIVLPARYDGNFTVDIFARLNVLETIELDKDSKYELTANGMVYLPGTGGAGNKLVFCPNAVAGTVTVSDVITIIGEHAFSGCTQLTAIIIPNTVSKIEKQAFSGYSMTIDGGTSALGVRSCSALKTVTFKGNRITPLVIGESAFGYALKADGTQMVDLSRCSALSELVFESGCNITEIGKLAFAGSALKTVELPVSVIKLGDYVFYGCDRLTDLSFAASDVYDENRAELIVGDGLLNGCSALKTLHLPYYFKYEGIGLFADCASLTAVTVDENNKYLTSIDGVLFDKHITTIYFYPRAKEGAYVLPDTITTIGSGVFNNKPNLTSVTVKDGVTTIGDGAFKDCVKLESVIFDGVWTENVSIGDELFNGCVMLSQVVLPNTMTEIGDRMFYRCANLEWVNIPENVTKIGQYAFAHCPKYLGSDKTKPYDGLFIPNSVQSIGYSAFYQCTALTKVVFEDGTTKLNMLDMSGNTDQIAYTFARCTSLKYVTLPERLENIGGHAFIYCALTEITIPKTVRELGNNAFGNCSALKNVYFAERESSDTLEFRNNRTSYGLFGGSIIEEIHLPVGLTRVPEYMFYEMPQLKKVYLPNTIANTAFVDNVYTGCAIGAYSFSGCSKLEYVEIAGGGTGEVSVGPYAFEKCRSLSTLILSDNLSTYTNSSGTAQPLVVDNMFRYCESLENITIVEGTNNKYYSIYGMIVNADKTEIIYCPYGKTGDVVIPSYITSIASQAFKSNLGITSLTFNNTPAEDKAYDESLDEEYRIGSESDSTEQGGDLVIGVVGSASNAGNSSFAYMRNLATVKLPTRLTTIGKYAFYACPKLATVTFGKDCKLTVIDESAFQDCAELTGIALPNAVAAIGGNAFNGDKKLATFTVNEESALKTIGVNALRSTGITALYIPEKVTDVGQDAFSGCVKLTTVTMPSSLGALNGVFGGCSKLGTITIYGDQSSVGSEEGIIYTTDANGKRTLVYYPMSKLPVSGTTGEEDYEEGTYTVPSDVIAISANAFAYNPYIKKIVIHNGVTSIGDKAFYMCTGLTTVKFDDDTVDTAKTALTVGNYAFAGCTNLSSVSFPKRLNTIGTYLFGYCTNLTTVLFDNDCELALIPQYAFRYSGIQHITIPKNVTKLDQNSFEYSTLSEITWNSNITEIGDCAFRGCKELASLTIPKSVNKLGSGKTSSSNSIIYDAGVTVVVFEEDSALTTLPFYAFSNVTSLKSITLSNTLKTIDYAAFLNCSGLETVTFLDDSQLEQIGNNTSGNNTVAKAAFGKCTSLTGIDLPNGILKIKNYMFAGCGLVEITLPNTLTEFGLGVFRDCADLEVVTFTPGLTSRINFVTSKTTSATNAFSGCTSLREITLPDTMTFTGTYLFRNLPALRIVNLPKSLETISNNAFNGCGIQEITIPASVKEIGSGTGATYVFQNSSITTVTFESSSTALSLGRGAFYGCTNLTEFTIPARVNSAGTYLFYGCTNLANVTFESGCSIKAIGDYFFTNTAITSIDIPTTVTSIGKYAFQNTALTSITVPASVASISDYTFDGAANLTSVTLPSNLQTIGAYAFRDTASLTSITLPSSLQTIGMYAFRGAALRDVTIPASVKSIGEYAFYGIGLTSITFDLDGELSDIGAYAFAYNNMASVEIPAKVTTIGDYCFLGCNDLTVFTVAGENKHFVAENNVLYDLGMTVAYFAAPKGVAGEFVLPETVTEIKPEAFADSKITSLIVEQNNVYIAGSAFCGSALLKYIEIADGAFLGMHAFKDCASLTDIVLGSGAVLDNRVFENCDCLLEFNVPDNAQLGRDLFADCANEVEINGTVDTSKYKGYDVTYTDDGSWYITITAASGTTVSAATFAGDVSLKGVVIEDGVKIIENGAFKNCTALETVVIADSVTSIGSAAFAGCTSLYSYTAPFIGTKANLNDEMDTAGVASSVFYTSGSDTNNKYVPESLKRIVLTGHVPVFHYSAFMNCAYIEHVEIVDKDAALIAQEFANCPSIKTLKFGGTEFSTSLSGSTEIDELWLSENIQVLHPSSMKAGRINKVYYEGTIEQWMTLSVYDALSETNYNPLSYGAMLHIDGQPLTHIVIPEGVTAIGAYAFAGATSIQSLTIPTTLTEIGENAFEGCVNLKSVHVTNLTLWNAVSFGDYNEGPTNPLYAGNADLYVDGQLVTNLVIPESVKNISASAFEGCGSIVSVEIPASVETFGAHAFANMPNLERLILHDGLTNLGDSSQYTGSYLFQNSAKLKYVTLPSTVGALGTSAFYGTGLETIVVPEGVTELPDSVFNGCVMLKNVTLPSTLKTIGDSAFYDCTALESITVPASVAVINDNAFCGCTALETLEFELSDNECSLSELGSSVFFNCTALTEITLPSSLVKIGTSCFDDWTDEQTINMSGFGGPMFEWHINWYGTSKATVVWDHSAA